MPLNEHPRCDDYIDDYNAPDCLRWWLLINRMPASYKMLADKMGCDPKLFATYNGKRVRVIMASRLGDVGITTDLTAKFGYESRVMVHELEEFSDVE